MSTSPIPEAAVPCQPLSSVLPGIRQQSRHTSQIPSLLFDTSKSRFDFGNADAARDSTAQKGIFGSGTGFGSSFGSRNRISEHDDPGTSSGVALGILNQKHLKEHEEIMNRQPCADPMKRLLHGLEQPDEQLERDQNNNLPRREEQPQEQKPEQVQHVQTPEGNDANCCPKLAKSDTKLESRPQDDCDDKIESDQSSPQQWVTFGQVDDDSIERELTKPEPIEIETRQPPISKPAPISTLTDLIDSRQRDRDHSFSRFGSQPPS